MLVFNLNIPRAPEIPQPRCPNCHEELDVIQSRVIKGEEVTIATPLMKVIHTCSHCHHVMGITDY